MQKLKICQFGHQSSGPLNLCLFTPFLSPFGLRTYVILAVPPSVLTLMEYKKYYWLTNS
jgi:hypothetical protein